MLCCNFFVCFIFFILFQIVLILLWLKTANGKSKEAQLQWQGMESVSKSIASHSCIHDRIIEERRKPGRKVYSVTPQVYDEPATSKRLHRKGRALLGISEALGQQRDAKQPIRIYLNYDAVGHSPDRDCRRIGDIVKVSVFCCLALY